MQADYLIIGQGISGTWLSYYLLQAGKSVVVLDDGNALAPSRLAAGIINPVTGRRHVTVWMAEELFPFLQKAYAAIGAALNITAISEKTIIDFFPSPQMRLSFQQRAEEDTTYVSLLKDEQAWQHNFDFSFGCGQIAPAFTVHLDRLLPAWQKRLIDKDAFLTGVFQPELLTIKKDSITYDGINTGKIIFCDGAAAATLPWFNRLPFAPNKGELLLLDCPGLDNRHIYKKGMMLAPLSEPGKWWLGSNYAWEYTDVLPTATFRQQGEQLLKSWLKTPFTITNHAASIRPATLERRPFVGLHPVQPAIGLLNGMGTKGCSLAPWFAKQFADLLVDGIPVQADASLERFKRILSA